MTRLHKFLLTPLPTLFSFLHPSSVLASDEQIDWTAINPSMRFRNPSLFISQLLGGTNSSGLYSGAGLLSIAIVFGGILLFIMLILGGFGLLTNATNPQGQEKAKQQITWAVAGFVLLFAAYWIIQLLQVIFSVSIVS